jgi:hypothetical protein
VLAGSVFRAFLRACGKLIVLVSFWSQVHLFIVFYILAIIAAKQADLTFLNGHPLWVELPLIFKA